MSTLDLDGLRRIMRECTGEVPGMDGDILDVPFGDLGYDSLALLEISARIEQEFGIRIPDEAIQQWPAARDLLDYVNPLIGPAAPVTAGPAR